MTEEPEHGVARLDHELKERQFDQLLREAVSAAHGPPPDLEVRTLAALADPRAAGRPAIGRARDSRTPRRPRVLAAAAAMLGIAVVMAVAFGQGNEDRAPAAAPHGRPPTNPGPQGQNAQGQNPARPAAELIRELANPEVRALAQRDLRRLGSQAIPAIRQALADPQSPRAELLVVLETMEAIAAPLAGSLADLIATLPTRDPLLGPAFEAAATIAPFASVEDQQAMERVILRTAFLADGPAAGPAAGGPAAGGGGAGGPAARGGAAVGGKPQPRRYSMRDIARLLHRKRLGPTSPPADLIAGLESESPYERELAARLLRAESPAAIAALRDAVVTDHPDRVDAKWQLEGFASGSFGFHEDWDRQIHLAAARSLVRLAPTQPAAARAHTLLLQFGQIAEQRRSALTVGRLQIGSEDRDAVTRAVIAALASEDEIVLRECIAAVSTLGIRSPEARAALLALASRQGSQIARLAESTLRTLER